MSHKLTEEEKEKQRQADLKRLREQTLENNKSFDPRLTRRPSVQLFSPTANLGLVPGATRGIRKAPGRLLSFSLLWRLVKLLGPSQLVESSVQTMTEVIRSGERTLEIC